MGTGETAGWSCSTGASESRRQCTCVDNTCGHRPRRPYTRRDCHLGGLRRAAVVRIDHGTSVACLRNRDGTEFADHEYDPF
jgi:hypothetical protein